MKNKGKSHTRCRLVSKSTTLDHLERPLRTLFQNTCIFGAHHENLKLVLKTNMINGPMKRCFKYGYCAEINIKHFIESANCKLFKNSQNHQHYLHPLLHPVKPQNHNLRPNGHIYQIPNYLTELHKRSFIPRCLFQYYYSVYLFFTILRALLF